VAAGASYGAAGSRQYTIADELLAFDGFGGSLISRGDASVQGLSGTAAAGFNMTFGPLLIGLELDGRWGDERAATTKAVDDAFTPNIGASIQTYEIKSDAAVHLSGRIGATIDQTLVYGKIGFGLAHISERFTADDTGLFVCSPNANLFPCTTNRIFGGAGTVVSENWVPSFVGGVGLEQNWGRFFVRLGAEAEAVRLQDFSDSVRKSAGRLVSPSGEDLGPFPGNPFSGNSVFGSASSDAFWMVRASGMIGVRF
jgi:opacity protein-like surface antigen